MGNGTSVEYQDNNPDYTAYNNINNKNDYLLFERCIYMTLDKYKSNFHISPNIFIDNDIAENINSIDELSTFIINRIKNTANEINKRYNVGSYVPAPIFVMYARKKEYKNTIFGQCYEDIKTGILESTNCSDSDDKETYKFIADNTKDDDEFIKKSTLGVFEFTNKYQFCIYYPNLNKDLKYMTNFKSYFITNTSMKNMVKDGLLFNIIDINVGYDKLRQDLYSIFIKHKNLSHEQHIIFEKKINNIISVLKYNNSKKYPHINDLYNICYTNGCVSDYGEDFENMLPKKTSDEGDFKKNADDKAPYFPTKCLRTCNYENNMFPINEDYYNDVKKKVADYIKDYQKNLENIKKDDNFDTNKYADTNIKLINELNNGYILYRHKNSDADLNNKDAKYHYSKDYNENILMELSKRNNSYPGITEIVFPLFKINASLISDYVVNLPWGDKLITPNYLLSDDINYPLTINKRIYSFNNSYYMSLSPKGIVYVYDIINERTIYTLNKIDPSYNIINYVTYESGTLNLYGKNNVDKDIVSLWNLPTIDMVQYSGLSPFSIIIENNGDLNVYGDRFKIITSDALKKLIKDSRDLLNDNKNNLDPLIVDINAYNKKRRKYIYNMDYDRCTRILKNSLELCDKLL